MHLLIKQISAVSVLCGVILSLTPEGSVKKVMNVLCSVVLISMIANAVSAFDFDSYSLEIAKIKEREDSVLKSSQELSDKLNRDVIEQQTKAYILDKAEELGVGEIDISVSAKWHTEGLWLPYYVEIKHVYNHELAEYIEAELGIASEMQKWC